MVGNVVISLTNCLIADSDTAIVFVVKDQGLDKLPSQLVGIHWRFAKILLFGLGHYIIFVQ